MRAFREIIKRSDKDHHKQVLNFPDFYSLSELKDLLFHVQERRFTIPLIKHHLNKLGLNFCGFESSTIVLKFKETHKHKEDPYDLDKWEEYEKTIPPNERDNFVKAYYKRLTSNNKAIRIKLPYCQ